MKYFVRVGSREFEIDVDGDQVTVGGMTRAASLQGIRGTPLRHLVVDGRSFTAPVEHVERGRWAVIARGDRRDVEVIDERARHIRGLTGGDNAPTGTGSLRAPMPGLVLRVDAAPGQQVTAGAGLVVLEAMKMENELKAPAAATVRMVLVQPGQVVEKGQVLLEFDAGR